MLASSSPALTSIATLVVIILAHVSANVPCTTTNPQGSLPSPFYACDAGQYCSSSGSCTNFVNSAQCSTASHGTTSVFCNTGATAVTGSTPGGNGFTYLCLQDGSNPTPLCTFAQETTHAGAPADFACSDTSHGDTPGTYDVADPYRYFCGPFTSVLGDPQFIGFRGQKFQVHGIDGAVYNIISHPTHQINSRFTFLSSGQCPRVVNSNSTRQHSTQRGTLCWTHPGSYMSEISVQQWVDDQLIQVLLIAGTGNDGFHSVYVNDKQVQIGFNLTFASTTLGNDINIVFVDSHLVTIDSPIFSYEMHNSDMFINQNTRANIPLTQLSSHGLLGQTWSSQTYNGAIKHIEGDVDDYALYNDQIFGHDFVFNQFQPQKQ